MDELMLGTPGAAKVTITDRELHRVEEVSIPQFLFGITLVPRFGGEIIECLFNPKTEEWAVYHYIPRRFEEK